MNLAKFSLIICPAMVTVFSMVAASAQAFEVATVAHAESGSELVTHHGVMQSGEVVSDPQVPRGCACSRCTQSAERLQGQFPMI